MSFFSQFKQQSLDLLWSTPKCPVLLVLDDCSGESGSFRPWVVSAGSFRPGSFRPYFGVSRFGLFWWDVSAVSRFGRGSFRPVLLLVQKPLIFVVNMF